MPEVTTDDSEELGDGIQIDMISAERMEGMRTMEKIRLILDGVHDGNVVILEEGLDPDEESKLIERTMSEINPDGFTGIEIETYPGSASGDSGFLGPMTVSLFGSSLPISRPRNPLLPLADPG